MKNTLIIAFIISLTFFMKNSLAQDSEPLHNIWILVELKDFDKTELDSLPRKPSLEINTKAKTYFGFSGCNQFNGTLEFIEDEVTFSYGPMTKAFCKDNSLENKYINAIQRAGHFKWEGNTLQLFEEEEWLCRFKKVD